jgi:hypothetical protein
MSIRSISIWYQMSSSSNYKLPVRGKAYAVSIPVRCLVWSSSIIYLMSDGRESNNAGLHYMKYSGKESLGKKILWVVEQTNLYEKFVWTIQCFSWTAIEIVRNYNATTN